VVETTDNLIKRLAADAPPVRRLAPPLRRAIAWLLGVALVAALAIFWFSDLDEFGRRARDEKLLLEMTAALATGIAAVIAAFYLSLPDRSSWWAMLPVPSLGLWIASSGYSCYDHWIAYGSDGWAWGESASCFRFIILSSVPLGGSLLVMIRRARPIAPIRVTAVSGLGVAAIAAVLLQFFHPFDITFMDLAVHVVAIGLVVLVSSLSGRIWSTAQR
jgi:hypothetical protein